MRIDHIEVHDICPPFQDFNAQTLTPVPRAADPAAADTRRHH